MPEASSGNPGNPFDLEGVRHLVELMEKHDLSEVSLRNGSQQWRLRRGAQVASLAAPQIAAPAAQPTAASQAPAPSPQKSATGGDAADENLLTIKSPTVGTFYPSPAEGEPPFVTPGSKITPKTIVCLIEAMKVFNQIPADVTGTIAAVLVKHGEAVEFGQPLFKVRP